MEHIYIPGIRRIKVPHHEGEHRSGNDFHFAINLQELTREVAFGLPGYASDSGTLQDFWSNDDLARLLFDPGRIEGPMQTEADTPQGQAVLQAVENLITGCDLNDAAIAGAMTPEGFSSRRTDANGMELGPTILFFAEGALRSVRLKGREGMPSKYRTLAMSRRYWVDGGKKELAEYLSWFFKDYVERVAECNQKLQEEMAPVQLALARVNDAMLAVTAMLDFAAPPAVRRKLWDSAPPKPTDDWVYTVGVLQDPPTHSQISNAEQFRDNTLQPLAKRLAETVRWMSSGAVERGKYWNAAKTRNDAAQRLLKALRTDEIILDLLESPAYVHPMHWLQLEHLLVNAFHQISTAPNALQDCGRSELLAMARVAAGGNVVVSVPTSAGARAREWAQKIMAFVPDNEIVEEPTPLSERLIALHGRVSEIHGQVSTLLTHGPTFARLYAATLPQMLHEVGRVTHTTGDTTALTKRAWLFRSLSGVGDLHEEAQQLLMDEVNAIIRKMDPTRARKLLGRDSRLFHETRRYFDSGLAWEAFGSALTMVALYETVAEGESEPAMWTINAFQAVIDASTTALAFGETLAGSRVYAMAMRDCGGGLLAKLEGVSDHPMFKGAGLFSGWLGLVSSVLAVNQVPKTAMTVTKEIAQEKVLMSAVQLVFSGLEVAIGAMPVAGVVLLVGQFLLATRATWAELMLPNVSALPGTGRYVRGLWEALENDRALKGVLKGVPWGAEVSQRISGLEERVLDVSQSGDGVFWTLRQPDFIKSPIVQNVLIEKYGLDKGVAEELVG